MAGPLLQIGLRPAAAIGSINLRLVRPHEYVPCSVLRSRGYCEGWMHEVRHPEAHNRELLILKFRTAAVHEGTVCL